MAVITGASVDTVRKALHEVRQVPPTAPGKPTVAQSIIIDYILRGPTGGAMPTQQPLEAAFGNDQIKYMNRQLWELARIGIIVPDND